MAFQVFMITTGEVINQEQ